MTLRFNPPKQIGRYALFVTNSSDPERGSFKIYDALGSAKVAYQVRTYNRFPDAKILENVDGQWYVLYEIKNVNSYKELPWTKEVQSGGWRSSYTDHKAVPMTRDEYAEWRVAVERERLSEPHAQYSPKETYGALIPN